MVFTVWITHWAPFSQRSARIFVAQLFEYGLSTFFQILLQILGPACASKSTPQMPENISKLLAVAKKLLGDAEDSLETTRWCPHHAQDYQNAPKMNAKWNQKGTRNVMSNYPQMENT